MVGLHRLLVLCLLLFAASAQPDLLPGRNHKTRSNLLKETLKSLLGPLGAMLMMEKIANKKEQDTCVDVLKGQLAAKDSEIQALRAQLATCEKRRENIAQEHALLKYKAERERLNEDYNEFKEPDLDDDDVISKQEYHAYVAKSVQEIPNLTPDDFPRFEDFDTDGDGYASFEEWQKYVYGEENVHQADQLFDELDELEDDVAPRMYEIHPHGASSKALFDRMETRQ